MTVEIKMSPAISPLRFNSLTLAAALTAATAATAAATVGLPVWAMFVGWVAFFTRGHSAKDALYSYLCLASGLGIGTIAAVGVGALLPLIGPAAFGVVVFAVAMLVVSLRAASPMNNIPAYFLGLITWFAAHAKPTPRAWLSLAAVAALGIFAARLAHSWQATIMRRA
jgi:hypothetical protein